MTVASFLNNGSLTLLLFNSFKWLWLLFRLLLSTLWLCLLLSLLLLFLLPMFNLLWHVVFVLELYLVTHAYFINAGVVAIAAMTITFNAGLKERFYVVVWCWWKDLFLSVLCNTSILWHHVIVRFLSSVVYSLRGRTAIGSPQQKMLDIVAAGRKILFRFIQ